MKKALAVAMIATLTLSACSPKAETTSTTCVSQAGNMALSGREYEVIKTVRLTVAEGKRLIAKGLLNNEEVKKKLSNGMVIITRGTTNTYIAEEFVNLSAPRGALVTGKIIPQGKEDFTTGIERLDDIVIVDGKIKNISYKEALAQAKDGDIVFKGANLINYDKGQAGVCIGAANGGTIGALLPYTESGAARWFVPVGLEKDCSADLIEYSKMLASSQVRNRTTLLEVRDNASIYTEIEAIQEFADVDLYPIAYGGVSGAEGGVSLMVCGSKAEVQKAVSVVESVLGEACFVE